MTAALPAMTGPAEATVDLDAIADNVAALARHAPTAAVMAVVKADGYGHGLVAAARAAVAGGAGWLGVAQLGEGLQVRAAGVRTPLLSWLHVPGDDFAGAITADIDLSVSAPWALAEIAGAAQRIGRPARIHLKVDTGLARNGCTPAEWPQLVALALAAQAAGHAQVVGIWSHLAWADAPAHPTVVRQRQVFEEALEVARAAGVGPVLRHLANSAATLTDPASHYDLVRPGIAVYGVSPVPDLGGPADFGLRPAMTLRGRLALVKAVGGGQGVSYGHEYVTTADTVLGLVPLGYADGIPRHAGNRGPLQVAGRRTRVAGRVCMDQVVVDLGAGSRATAGEPAVFFGDGLDGVPTVQDWADAADTIGYEIITRLGSRVPRRYVGTAGSGAGPQPVEEG